MTKKTFNKQLRVTVENQDKELQDRFDRADSILLKPQTTTPEPVPQKSNVVRDTFSMPPADSARIEALRTVAAKAGRISSKSEIVRAGLHALSNLESQELIEVLSRLEKVTPGRKG